MAKVYADLIRKGMKTIEDVPARLRADVEALQPFHSHYWKPPCTDVM